MTIEDDPYTTWDAAYVLGALTPADRRTFEAHLVDCEPCRAGVAELAGLPGLLALVPEDVAMSLVNDENSQTDEDERHSPAPPDEMFHRLVRETERRRRRERFLAIGVAVAAAAAAVAIAVPVTIGLRDDSGGSSSVAEDVVTARSMSALEPTPLSANFQLIALPDGGTRIDLECSYAAASTPKTYTGRYAMFVTARGVEFKAAEWDARAGDVVTPTVTTAEAPGDIERVDIRSAPDNRVILYGDV